MYLEVRKTKNNTYLYKVTSRRVNKKQVKDRVKLGDLDYLKEKLKDVTDDPIDYYTKLIKEENDRIKDEECKYRISETFKPKAIDYNESVGNKLNQTSKNLGCIFLSRIYHGLFLDEVCKKIKRIENIKLPLDKVLQLLIYSRVVNPDSKLSDYNNKDSFAEIFNVSLDDIYRSLRYFYKHKNLFIESIRDNIYKFLKLDMKNLHVDGSNVYIYTREGDDSEENTILKVGYSKEHMKLPIAQFLYVTDSNGLPLNFKVFPGNMPDVALYSDFLKETSELYNKKKKIIVADAGFVSNNNIVNTLLSKNGYIFKQSLLRLNKEELSAFINNIKPLMEKIIKENPNAGNLYTSICLDTKRRVTNIYGETKTVTIPQKFVFTYSRKYDSRSEKIREETLEQVDKYIKDKRELDNIFKRVAYGLLDVKNDNTDVSIDEEKLKKYKDVSGYSLYITSELNLPDSEVIRAYKNQYKIEQVFRDLKSEIKVRPIYLNNEDSICSHMLVCFLSLVFLRIINIGMNKEMSVETIIVTLRSLKITDIKFTTLKSIENLMDNARSICKFLNFYFEKDSYDGKEIRKLFGDVKKNRY